MSYSIPEVESNSDSQDVSIHQLPHWIDTHPESTMQLCQDGNTVHVSDDDIANIIATRFALDSFTMDTLKACLVGFYNPGKTLFGRVSRLLKW